MAKLFRKAKKAGLAPGTLIDVEQRSQKAVISIIDYDQSNVVEKAASTVEESFPFRDTETVTWINIEGIEVDLIKKIDTHFGIHPLVLEDIVHTNQRPKLEEYDNYLYIVLQMIYFDKKTDDILSEQVSIILGPNCVISVQEKVGGDVFDPVRERIRNEKTKIRKSGADFLAYALIDAVVDNYFIILERLGEEIEELEEKLYTGSGSEIIHEMHKLKRDLIFMRKQVWPLRDVVNSILRGESKLIKHSTGIYFRDVYDHLIHTIDTVESFRDILSGMHDIHLSNISYKMNEVMKVLTIISTIFIPLTFIVGVYGMNFKFMPELDWHWGYPALWIIMLGIALGMYMFFKRRNWL